MAQKPQRLLIVTGPESSGKTTLAQWLARRLSTPLVPEIARGYLEARQALSAREAQGAYTADDVAEIALLQQSEEHAVLARGHACVVADTDYRTIELWFQEKYPDRHFVRPTPADAGTSVERYYLLCLPDLAWQPDPLRENPFDRHRLFQRQLRKLDADAAAYRVIWGQGAFRERLAWQYLKTLLGE